MPKKGSGTTSRGGSQKATGSVEHPERRSGLRAPRNAPAAQAALVAEEYDPHNIFGTDEARNPQRVGKKLMGWANDLLDMVLKGSHCLTTVAGLDEVAKKLEDEIDDKMEAYKHLFNRSKCLTIVQERAASKSRSGGTIGAPVPRRGRGRTPVVGSRRTNAVAFDAAAVLKRKETEAAAVAHAKKLNDEDAAVMSQGAAALENLNNLIITTPEDDQIEPKDFDLAKQLVVRGSECISHLQGLHNKASGSGMSISIQNGINTLKNKALAIKQWPVSKSPDGHVFVQSQTPGYGAAAAAAASAIASAPDSSGKRSRNVKDIKRSNKAFKNAMLTIGTKVHFIGAMGSKMLQELDVPEPAFDIDHETIVDEEEAEEALLVLKNFMKQRRRAVGEDKPKELIGCAVYAIGRNSNPIAQSFYHTYNEDQFLSKVIADLVSSRHSFQVLCCRANTA